MQTFGFCGMIVCFAIYVVISTFQLRFQKRYIKSQRGLIDALKQEAVLNNDMIKQCKALLDQYQICNTIYLNLLKAAGIIKEETTEKPTLNG